MAKKYREVLQKKYKLVFAWSIVIVRIHRPMIGMEKMEYGI